MDLRCLELRVNKDVRELNLPVNYGVQTHPYKLEFPNAQRTDNVYIIKIAIGNEKDKYFTAESKSFLAFNYNEDKARLEEVGIELEDSLKEKGYGRSLVELMEDLAVDLDCRTIRLNLVQNPPFWKHMGYRDKKDFWEKRF